MRLTLIESLFFALLTFVTNPSRLVADDWWSWRGPTRNGISSEVEWKDAWPTSGPTALWKRAIGTGFSSLAVKDDLVYTIGNADDMDTVVCLKSLTGEMVWSRSYSAPLDDRFFEGGPTSTPSVDESHVYVLSRNGEIMSLDAKTGHERWSKNLPREFGVEIPGWGFAGSPLAIGDRLILSVGQSGVALNKKTGEVLWQSEGEAGYMTPLPIEREARTSVIIASGKFYHEVDIETGSIIWRHRWLTNFGCNAADPIYRDGKLFISSGYNRGSALLELAGDSATVVWDTKEYQNQWSSSLLLDEHVYGVDGNDTGDRQLKCLEFKTGKIRWSYDGLGSASLLAAGDRLIVLSDQGELLVAKASPERFHPIARAQVLTGKCWTVPVLANGLLYCRNADGEVVCLDLRAIK